MNGKKKYFHHNWEEIESAPAEFFPELSWEDFYEWRVANWQLPSSVCCIIREENKKTGKIKEHVYSRQSSAVKKLESIINESYVTVVNHDAVSLVTINKPSEDSNE